MSVYIKQLLLLAFHCTLNSLVIDILVYMINTASASN